MSKSLDGRPLYLGIDPGHSGGFAILEEGGLVVLAEKMPETERDTADILEEFGSRVRLAHLEKVGARPKQGVASTWKFGQHYGMLRGFLIALKIPFTTVTPRKWQQAMGCLTGGDKNVSKARAQELYPALKITHAIADALLIAEHCRRVSRY